MDISTAFHVPVLCLSCTIEGCVTVGGGEETGTRVWLVHRGLDVCCVRISKFVRVLFAVFSLASYPLQSLSWPIFVSW